VRALCLFMDDLDSSNTGFGLRFIDFLDGLEFLVFLARFRYSGSCREFVLGCSSSPQNFVSRFQVVWEIHRSKVWGCLVG
jgi:hypothetical protein